MGYIWPWHLIYLLAKIPCLNCKSLERRVYVEDRVKCPVCNFIYEKEVR